MLREALYNGKMKGDRPIYTVSQNKLHKLFVSELRQMPININNFWYVDNRIAKVLPYIHFPPHLTHLTALTC